ncbi:uncharacterized protein [Palaemon carinicauda]|uniref:uncharacterized protein isoform X2 n=1 Tax=Palaemon carinicauda TaxID=392227 RepID=UPI0035B697B9
MNSGGHVEKEMEEQRENNELQQFMDDVKILWKMGISRHPRRVSSSFQSHQSLGPHLGPLVTRERCSLLFDSWCC